MFTELSSGGHALFWYDPEVGESTDGVCIGNYHTHSSHRLLRGEDPTPSSFLAEGAVELCGHMLVTCTVFSTDVRVPFMLFQQRLCEVLDGVEGGSSWGKEEGRERECSWCRGEGELGYGGGGAGVGREQSREVQGRWGVERGRVAVMSSFYAPDQLQPVFQQCIAFLHFLECYVHRRAPHSLITCSF